jgi:hypothetical protein
MTNAPRRCGWSRLEPNAKLCVAVAQVVKVNRACTCAPVLGQRKQSVAMLEP